MEQLFKDNIYSEKSRIDIIFKDKNNLEFIFIFTNFENEWKFTYRILFDDYDVESTKSMKIIYKDPKENVGFIFDEEHDILFYENNNLNEYISEINKILSKNTIEKVFIGLGVKPNKNLFPKSTKKVIMEQLFEDIFHNDHNIEKVELCLRDYDIVNIEYLEYYLTIPKIKISSKYNEFPKYIENKKKK